MSRILCIIDGMTDPQFRARDYPALSSMRLQGYVDTCRGREPESFGCILRLLGVMEAPKNLRGYAEALGAGIEVEKDDLILRGSWFALDGQGRCTAPAAGRKDLGDFSGCRYYPLQQYKCILVFPGLSGALGQIVTHPPFRCAGRPARQLCPEGPLPLRELFLHCLGPKDCLIPWGQSAAAGLPVFPQRAAAVTGTGIVRGIARMLGMELADVEGATGDVNTDLAAKVRAALDAAERAPFVLLHINGADEAAHRKNREEKRGFLQKVDRQVLAELLACGHEVIVASDHGTDPATGLHVGGEQPVFIG